MLTKNMIEKFIIFPTPIIKTQLEENLNIFKEFALSLKENKIFTNVGGFHSSMLNINEPPLNSLKDKITKIANDNFFEDLKLKKNLEIENMWVNINGYKDYNQEHFHPYYIISGIYYVNVNDQSGELKLHKNDSLHLMSLINTTKEFNLFTSSSYLIKPKNNMLILFPSWIKHSVMPNLSQEKRISIAFDLC